MSYRILLADPIAEEGLAPLLEDDRFELVRREGDDETSLAEQLAAVDGVIVRSSTTLDRAVLAGARRLKVIGRAGVGVDNIDVTVATELGIPVLNAPAGNTISAAELTLALVLAVVRCIPAADRSMRAGAWDRKIFRGMELQGKTLGLVGAGRIGAEVARRLRAFGMRVLAHDPFLTAERARALELESAPLERVLEDADVLTLHVPLTDATRGLIGAAEIARMKRGAFLVNAARGGIVDEEALLAALRDGRLAGAALDVYALEPLPPDHPLRSAERVVLTPHLGAATREAQRNVAAEVAQAVRAALLEGDLSRAVNAPALDGEEMRRLRPLLELGRALGRLGCALLSEGIASVEVRLAEGTEAALQPVAAAVMEGVLDRAVGAGAVNFVNSLHLARARGIAVQRSLSAARTDYADYLEVHIAGQGAGIRVAGALLAEGHPRVVRIGEYHVDILPRGTLLALRNRDVPGVIGRVGTVLGEAGVNIAEYHQAREEAGGEALAAISVDGRLAPEPMAALRAVPEVLEVHQVELA